MPTVRASDVTTSRFVIIFGSEAPQGGLNVAFAKGRIVDRGSTVVVVVVVVASTVNAGAVVVVVVILATAPGSLA